MAPGGEPRGRDRVALAAEPFTGQQAPVVAAPDDEVPAGPVPKPAEEHREDEVPVGLEPAVTVPPEGDVEVVAEPARERHVPASPEVRDAGGQIRPREVQGEVEAEEPCAPDRHVRVPG